jgi:hypothetical protein
MGPQQMYPNTIASTITDTMSNGQFVLLSFTAEPLHKRT